MEKHIEILFKKNLFWPIFLNRYLSSKSHKKLWKWSFIVNILLYLSSLANYIAMKTISFWWLLALFAPSTTYTMIVRLQFAIKIQQRKNRKTIPIMFSIRANRKNAENSSWIYKLRESLRRNKKSSRWAQKNVTNDDCMWNMLMYS